MNARSAFAWSLRRELWENRSVYVAPVVVAALALAAFLYHVGKYTEGIRAAQAGVKLSHPLVTPFAMSAAAILFFAWIVALFYCLDALASERRDRSILFWKSMPVSDVTTVLAKLTVPLVVVPAWACIVALVTQAIMLVATAVVLAAKGIDGEFFWANLPFVQMPVGMVWGMAAHALWFAPIMGWLLLVSGWARRAAFMWAFLPFFGAFAFEQIAFGTSYVLGFVKWRLIAREAFAADVMKQAITQTSQLDPVRFFTTPGLWLGFLVAAVFIAAAIQYRRYREPL